MLHKKKPLTIKIKQKHITYVSLLLKKAIIGFLSNYLHNYVNLVQYKVTNQLFYSNLPPSRVPCVSDISSSVPPESKLGFWSYKMKKLTSYGRSIYRESIKVVSR